MPATSHGRFVEADFARLKNFGIHTVREGLRWHLIERARGSYEFSPGWRTAFADFAYAFGRLLRRETGEIPVVFMSWAWRDVEYLNPFERERGCELKPPLVRGAVQASDALRAEVPDVRLVATELVIQIAGDRTNPADVLGAEKYRNAMFEAWDMLCGRMEPELGGDESYLDVLVVNYYDKQWWNHGRTIHGHETGHLPYRDILTEIYNRYERPRFISGRRRVRNASRVVSLNRERGSGCAKRGGAGRRCLPVSDPQPPWMARRAPLLQRSVALPDARRTTRTLRTDSRGA
jgi:hypothetical protein